MDPQQLATLIGYGSPAEHPIDPMDLQGLAAHLAGHDTNEEYGGAVTDPTQVDPSLVRREAGMGADSPPSPYATRQEPRLGGSTSSSGSVSASGFSGDKFKQVKKTQTALDKEMDQDRQGVADEYAPIKKAEEDAANQGNGAVDAEIGTPPVIDPVTGKVIKEGTGEMGKIHAIAEAKKRQADAYAGFKNQEESAWAASRAEAEGIKTEYRAALANYAAAQVNPSQLWEQAGKAGQAQMLFGVFAHDFLGSKGIHTSAMDNINAAITRNIDSQVEAIRRKGDVAQGFKDLWNMQRMQSSSDAEARERMRGFYLHSLDAQMDSEMGKYDSQIAQAKGQAAKAAIAKEKVKNDFAVQQHIDAAANARTAQRVTMYGHQLSASIAREQMASQERIAGIRAGGKAPIEGDDLLIDTSKSGENKARWRFTIKDPELRRDVRKKAVATTTAVEGLRTLRELQSKMDSEPDPIAKSRLLNEIQRRQDAVQAAMIEAMSLDYSGKVVSDKEAARIEKLVPAKTWFTNGTNLAIISDTINRKIDEVNALIHQTTRVIEKGDPAYGYQSAPTTDSFANAEQDEAKILGGPKHGEAEDTPDDKAVEAITRPDAFKERSETLSDVTHAYDDGNSPKANWAEFTKAHPEYSEREDGPARPGTGKIEPSKKKAEEPSAAFVGMDALRVHAEKNDTLALDYLVKWAKLDDAFTAPDGSDPNNPENKQKQAMAMWELSKLTEDKNKSKDAE